MSKRLLSKTAKAKTPRPPNGPTLAAPRCDFCVLLRRNISFHATMWGLAFLRDPVSHILTHNPHTRSHTNPTRRSRGNFFYLISLAFGQWRSSMFGVLGLYDHRPPTTAMMHHPETVETKRCRKDFSPKLQRQKRPGPKMAQTTTTTTTTSGKGKERKGTERKGKEGEGTGRKGK